MTQVQKEMFKSKGTLTVPIVSVASGNTDTFRPLTAARSPLLITGFTHYGTTLPGTAPTVKLRTWDGVSAWEDVSLTGGDDTPDITTSINEETTDGDGTSSATNYIAEGEGLQIVIDNSAGGGTDADGLVIEVYMEEA